MMVESQSIFNGAELVRLVSLNLAALSVSVGGTSFCQDASSRRTGNPKPLGEVQL